MDTEGTKDTETAVGTEGTEREVGTEDTEKAVDTVYTEGTETAQPAGCRSLNPD